MLSLCDILSLICTSPLKAFVCETYGRGQKFTYTLKRKLNIYCLLNWFSEVVV